MKRINDLKEYQDNFSDPKIRKNAYKQALDIRKFEIEFYWKRTTYFWTLIAATLNGTALLLVSTIGLCFSVGWYFVNRGSKYWQGNWERHVDLLEDEFSGPLYKTTPSPESYSFLKMNSAYPFSVSRINQILSLFVVLIWMALFVSSILKSNWFPISNNLLGWVLVGLALGCIFSLLRFGRTKKTEVGKPINLECREYKNH